MVKFIYIVEDDENIQEIISYNLEKNGYKVRGFNNGKDFLESFEKKKPDIVILDLMLPDMDGFDICKEIKNRSRVPVIILSAKDNELDKVLGFELGADDYIAKPFSIRELLSRIKNVLQRTESSIKNDYQKLIIDNFNFGDIRLSIDEKGHEIFLDENKISLNPKEFKILTFLIKNLNRLSTRNDLVKIIWGKDHYRNTRTLDVNIRRLRIKMFYKDFGKKYLKTIHGLGYKLVDKVVS